MTWPIEKEELLYTGQADWERKKEKKNSTDIVHGALRLEAAGRDIHWLTG